MKHDKKFILSAAVIAAILLGVGAEKAYAQNVEARADFVSCGKTFITGVALLTERASEEGVTLVDVSIFIYGLSDGKHAVHIHETGNCTPCSAANGHFDPGPAGDSRPDANHPFHSGDLVNVNVVNGEGLMQTTTSRITLSPGPLSVFPDGGTAIIIHTDPDTYCPNGEVAGCAGGTREACGIIQLRK
jgi:Cu-Zn family superoxide dismutase